MTAHTANVTRLMSALDSDSLDALDRLLRALPWNLSGQ